ncbi:MAG TPA: methyltransferase [Roseiflexaceae bacterium]|nr:methyltransferase [Roseiflexaceae bacterium]
MALTNKQFRQQIVGLARTGAPAEPRCPYAPPPGQCGGCAFQAVAYADQVRAKHAALRGLWAPLLPAAAAERIAFVASPDPYGYRTRMDYVASKERFGLRRGGKFNYIVDLGECHLLPPAGFAAARAVYERAVALGLPDYNLRTHEGFLRYVVVRRSPDDELLLAAITAAPDEAGARAAAMQALAETALAQPGVAGFHWLVNDTRTDISFGREERHWGAALLPMRVGARTLHIGPNTFFQNNVHLLLPLLDDVRAAVANDQRPLLDNVRAAVANDQRPTTNDQQPAAVDEQIVATTPASSFAVRRSSFVVADLYGGAGTIALHLADSAAHVTCVESVAESAQLATQNAAANGCGNVEAVAADVLAFLRAQPAGRYDVVVADPPRTGLGPEVCQELLRLRPARVVYVSCNPLTQVEDARALAEGYRLTRLTGYDMFPQTPHMESLAVFERNED